LRRWSAKKTSKAWIRGRRLSGRWFVLGIMDPSEELLPERLLEGLGTELGDQDPVLVRPLDGRGRRGRSPPCIFVQKIGAPRKGKSRYWCDPELRQAGQGRSGPWLVPDRARPVMKIGRPDAVGQPGPEEPGLEPAPNRRISGLELLVELHQREIALLQDQSLGRPWPCASRGQRMAAVIRRPRRPGRRSPRGRSGRGHQAGFTSAVVGPARSPGPAIVFRRSGEARSARSPAARGPRQEGPVQHAAARAGPPGRAGAARMVPSTGVADLVADPGGR